MVSLTKAAGNETDSNWPGCSPRTVPASQRFTVCATSVVFAVRAFLSTTYRATATEIAIRAHAVTAVTSTAFRRRERNSSRSPRSRLMQVGHVAEWSTRGSEREMCLDRRARSRRKASSGQGPTGVVSPASTRRWCCFVIHASKRSSTPEDRRQLSCISENLQGG